MVLQRKGDEPKAKNRTTTPRFLEGRGVTTVSKS